MDEAPVSIGYVALRCRCPRCGRGKLYGGLLKVADQCGECGLDLKAHEQGDGPATLSILFIGALVGIAASVVEVMLTPPFWVHAVLWTPLIIVGSLLSLRWIKAAIIAAQYQFKREDFRND